MIPTAADQPNSSSCHAAGLRARRRRSRVHFKDRSAPSRRRRRSGLVTSVPLRVRQCWPRLRSDRVDPGSRRPPGNGATDPRSVGSRPGGHPAASVPPTARPARTWRGAAFTRKPSLIPCSEAARARSNFSQNAGSLSRRPTVRGDIPAHWAACSSSARHQRRDQPRVVTSTCREGHHVDIVVFVFQPRFHGLPAFIPCATARAFLAQNSCRTATWQTRCDEVRIPRSCLHTPTRAYTCRPACTCRQLAPIERPRRRGESAVGVVDFAPHRVAAPRRLGDLRARPGDLGGSGTLRIRSAWLRRAERRATPRSLASSCGPRQESSARWPSPAPPRGEGARQVRPPRRRGRCAALRLRRTDRRGRGARGEANCRRRSVGSTRWARARRPGRRSRGDR